MKRILLPPLDDEETRQRQYYGARRSATARSRMTKHITAEASAMIDEAVEATLREFPNSDELAAPLRAYLRRRWPFIIKTAITQEASA